jgi:hypothetical protein
VVVEAPVVDVFGPVVENAVETDVVDPLFNPVVILGNPVVVSSSGGTIAQS